MSEKQSENSNMSSIAWAQHALHNHISPPHGGYRSVKDRLRHATRVLTRKNWTPNRVRDCWYADPRVRLDADEIKDLEAITGLRYGQQELRDIDELIARADALLDGQEADFYRPFVDAFRQMARLAYRAGTQSRDRGE